jgi:hypothetical protein
LEKKWAILIQEPKDTEKELASLGFLQRLFGEKGRFLKTRLARIKTDQERVRGKIMPQRLRGVFDEIKKQA